MTLKNDLYTITECTPSGAKTTYRVALNAAHFIYKAHFPGMPITPGVCIVQIAKELLEQQLGESLELEAVKNVKFLSVVSPTETPEVSYTLQPKEGADADHVQCSAEVRGGDTLLTKISFSCRRKMS